MRKLHPCANVEMDKKHTLTWVGRTNMSGSLTWVGRTNMSGALTWVGRTLLEL